MHKYCVVTPPVEYQDVIVDGQGPWYYEAEAIDIEARSAKDAVAFGVKIMLKTPGYKYCRDQRADNMCPYTGVKALKHVI